LFGLVLLFSARRLLWVLAAFQSKRPTTPEQCGHRPDVCILIPVHNEETDLPGLLNSVANLDYPSQQLTVCIVDDGSTDSTWKIATTWAENRPNVHLTRLPEKAGKAEAMNFGLQGIRPGGSIVVVYDADQRPRPESLSILVQPFQDPQTGAVAGYRNPIAQELTAIAAYACLEAWMYQLVNLSAKEALGLNPPTMGGNCAYRRSLLEQIGGFPSGLYSEDIYVSLAVVAAGGRTHFVEQAIADHFASTSLPHFFNQRLRWTHGLMTARSQVHGLEAALVVSGYLDRIAVLGLALSAAFGHTNPWLLSVYLAPAFTALAVALFRAQPSWKLAGVVITTLPAMFALDVGTSVLASLRTLTPKPIRWLNRLAGSPSLNENQ